MAALKNPVEELAPIITRLYNLAGNSQVPAAQQQALLIQAHDLRGDLITLVAMQFSQNTAAYQNAMTNLADVTGALDQAERDIMRAIAVVNGAAQLAKSIDDLLKEAVKVAGALGVV